MYKDEKKMGIRSKYRQKYGAVPYALDLDGKVVPPHEAASGKYYRCPSCKREVVLRHSKKRRTHFAHLHKRRCKLDESSIVLAKHVLQLVFDQWLKGKGDPIEVLTFCEMRYEIPRGEINEVKVDHKVRGHKKRNLWAHISLFDRYSLPVMNIKIVEDSPSRHIRHPSWLEVSAEEILANPYLLSSLNPHMTVPPFLDPVQLQLSLF